LVEETRKVVSRRKPPKPPAPGVRKSRAGDLRNRKYVEGRVAGKSKLQAAKDAGFAESTARNAKQKIESNPDVQALFSQALENAGVTDALLAQRIREGLEANCVVRETQFANREVLVDFRERREMAELIVRLKGYLIEKRELSGHLTYEELLGGSYE
jgi:hypothetical protein